MRSDVRAIMTGGALPIILLAAVAQGWALYGLHQSIKHQAWPATDAAWLIALYAFVLFVPLTVQLLSEYAKEKTHWLIVAAIGVAFFYFGWHHGGSVYNEPASRFVASGDFFPATFVMGLLWLLLLPFIQARLSAGRWTADYTLLFTTAWRNKLMLAEAALFTGLFWLLLMLWQTLFHMLGIDYFKELFEEPLFVYPITTLVFSIALHLIGSVERLTAAILEQLLNVLKWLAIVAGFILALFTVALLFKLPGLVFHGQKAIGAAWLLWLVAVTVLLINAAYRDGSVQRPYPAWIAFALRCVIPLTVIVSATALYALMIRARHYGLTVERVWAFVVAGIAMLYSVGYSIAAFGAAQWLQRVGRVNVIVALVSIATIVMTLTPVLSPFRLAANSQYRLIVSSSSSASTSSALGSSAAEADIPLSAMRYLRFDAGNYGLKRLRELSTLTAHPDAQRIQKEALAALKAENRWDRLPVDTDDALNGMIVFPVGYRIDAKLRDRLTRDMRDPNKRYLFGDAARSTLAALFVDLHGDATEEFVVLSSKGGIVYRHIDDEWKIVGTPIRQNNRSIDWKGLLQGITEGKVQTTVPEWKSFAIGAYRYDVRVTDESAVEVVNAGSD